MIALRPSLAALAATALLAACGGGGGGGSGSTDDYNALAAWQNLLTRQGAWAVTGTANNGQVYELRLGIAPVANASFPLTGAAANRADISSSIRQNGAVLGSAVTELYYDSQFLVLGSRVDSSGAVNCNVATAVAAPPVATKVGTSGVLFATNELDGCAGNSTPVGSSTTRWTIEAFGGVVFFCIDTTDQDLANPPNVSTEKDCVEVARDGTIGLRARISVASAGFSITAVN